MTKNILLEGVTLKYGHKTVLDNLSITFPCGQFSAIMGASGIGKTSILRLLAGLIPSKNFSGKIQTNGAKIAYCFQEPRLFPWLTVSENISVVNESKSSPLHSSVNTKKSFELLELRKQIIFVRIFYYALKKHSCLLVLYFECFPPFGEIVLPFLERPI